MTDPDCVKLLFGPYKAPALKRGDRARCLYRDTTVIITRWSDAPIPGRDAAPSTRRGAVTACWSMRSWPAPSVTNRRRP